MLILSIDFRKCKGNFIFSENGMEISDSEHDIKLKFIRHTQFTHINTICEYCHLRVISEIHALVFLFK